MWAPCAQGYSTPAAASGLPFRLPKMSSNLPPNNTDLVRKLLAIKRYEQPPQGSFEASRQNRRPYRSHQHSRRVPLVAQWLVEWTERPLLTSAYGLLSPVWLWLLWAWPKHRFLTSFTPGDRCRSPPASQREPPRSAVARSCRTAVVEASSSSVSPVFDAEAALWSASAPHVGIERVSFRTR